MWIMLRVTQYPLPPRVTFEFDELSTEVEKLYEELKKKDDKDRAERLRLAAERRKELGQ